jgi:hypothetical protein
MPQTEFRAKLISGKTPQILSHNARQVLKEYALNKKIALKNGSFIVPKNYKHARDIAFAIAETKMHGKKERARLHKLQKENIMAKRAKRLSEQQSSPTTSTEPTATTTTTR